MSLILMLAGGQAAAYNDRDPQFVCGRWWNTNPMTITYDWGPSLQDPSYTWRQAFEQSAASWNGLGWKTQFSWTSGSSNKLDAYTEADNKYGKTITYCIFGFLNHFEAYANSYYGPDYNWDFLGMRFVTGHELGHGLGFIHSNYFALMNTYFPTSGAWAPTGDDQAGLQAMYP